MGSREGIHGKGESAWGAACRAHSSTARSHLCCRDTEIPTCFVPDQQKNQQSFEVDEGHLPVRLGVTVDLDPSLDRKCLTAFLDSLACGARNTRRRVPSPTIALTLLDYRLGSDFPLGLRFRLVDLLWLNGICKVRANWRELPYSFRVLSARLYLRHAGGPST